MKFIKEEDEERKDYILQKDKPTRKTITILIVILAVLIISVLVSGYKLGYLS